MPSIVLAVQIVTALAGIAGLFLIWKQLKHQNKQMMYQVLTELHEKVISRPMKEAMFLVNNTCPKKLADPKSREQLEKIEMVLNFYDLIGFRVKKGVLPEEDVLETEWPVLLRLRKQLALFIENEKKLRGHEYFKTFFLELAEKADDYRKKRELEEMKPFTRKFEKQAEASTPREVGTEEEST